MSGKSPMMGGPIKMPMHMGAEIGGKGKAGKGKAGKGKAKGKGKGKAGGKKAPVSRSVRAGLQVRGNIECLWTFQKFDFR